MTIFNGLHRIYAGFVNPPLAAKQDGALRVGLLGASNIAPMALILPSRSHPEVIVAAVAARDQKKAETYAKKHSIPIVHATYQELLDDPSIDCVYIALPNSLHYEWALRSLQAGKHILLEKPSCSNAEEARMLFNHPLATGPNSPVLLEAFHYRFHPAWQKFLSLIHDDPLSSPIQHAYSQQYLVKGAFPKDDIRFNYSLSGGALMDFGTYNVSCLRQILRSEMEVVDASYRGRTVEREGDEQIDQAIRANYKTASGSTAEFVADLASSGGWPAFLPSSWTQNWPSMGWPKCVVELKEKEVEADQSVGTGELHTVQRKVTFWNHLAPSIYHRIDVVDTHAVRSEGSVVRTWIDRQTIKAYHWLNKDNLVNVDWWPTYRYQLEEFVNRIRGRPGSGVWVDGADSIGQMEAIDYTYAKAGLKPRPTSQFRLELG